jgi:hypothetical protein
MRKFNFIAAGLLLMASCLVSFGQTTGGVKGKVKNMNGEGIANASITARRDGKDIKTARAGRGGEFLLDGLDSGVYNFVVDAKGYGTGVKSNVEIKAGKIRDLGGNLILMIDRGSQVIIRGSVFYKDGTSVPGCEVEVATLDSTGQAKKITTLMTDLSGQFSYRRPDASSTYRFTAKFRGVTGVKDLAVDTAAIYTVAVTLPVGRGERQ